MAVKVNKKVELLRAMLLNRMQDEDKFIENLREVAEEVQNIDLELIEDFKKIYQLGKKQLSRFIGVFNKAVASKKLDEYSILYYTTVLRNGPFREEDEVPKRNDVEKDGWRPTPDIMGVQGNLNRSNVQTPVCDYANGEIGDVSVDTYKLKSEASGDGVQTINYNIVTFNKLPEHVLKNTQKLEGNVNKLYGYNMSGGLILDDELREVKLFCKASNNDPHGAFLIADKTSWENTTKISEAIFKRVESHLKDVNFRLYVFNKLFNRFDKSKNKFKAKNHKVKHKTQSVKDDIKGKEIKGKQVNIGKNGAGKPKIEEVTIETDLVGNVFESDEIRKEKIEVYQMFQKGFPDITKKEIQPHIIDDQLNPRIKGEN